VAGHGAGCNVPDDTRPGPLAWFRSKRPTPAPSPTVAAPETTIDRAAAFDRAEFGRLLNTGNADDLKIIARAMTQLDQVADAARPAPPRPGICGRGSVAGPPVSTHWRAALLKGGPGSLAEAPIGRPRAKRRGSERRMAAARSRNTLPL
jgi:hypothetical protein